MEKLPLYQKMAQPDRRSDTFPALRSKKTGKTRPTKKNHFINDALKIVHHSTTNRSFIKELRVVCGNNTYIYNPMKCTMLKLEENVLNIRDIILERDKDLLKTKESRAKLYYTYREEIWNFLAAHCKGVTVIKNGRNTLEV